MFRKLKEKKANLSNQRFCQCIDEVPAKKQTFCFKIAFFSFFNMNY